MLDKKHIEMEMHMGFFNHNNRQINIIEHYIITTLVKMFPHFGKLDIDYTGLEKYLK
jgi:hypothetical protein